MANVRINKGPIEAELRPRDVPPEKWRQLVEAKSMWLGTRLNYDCRCLLVFMEEAEEMWQEAGFESADDLIANGYELDPDDARLACQWLEKHRPEWAVPYKDAVTKARQQAETVKPGNPTGVNQYTIDEVQKAREQAAEGKDGNLSNRKNSIQGGGTGAEYLLRRLARDHTDILDAYERGEFPSVRQAAIAAGIVKVKTRSEQIQAHWRKLTGQERLALLKWMTDYKDPED